MFGQHIAMGDLYGTGKPATEDRQHKKKMGQGGSYSKNTGIRNTGTGNGTGHLV